MATLQVDANGIRIKTDILTSGYITQHIEKQFQVLIPPEIKALCFEYWFIKVCDEWDKSFHAKNTHLIELIGQTAKRISSVDMITVYGMQSVNSGEFEWRMKVKSRSTNMCIGIIHDKLDILQKCINNYDYDLDEHGCWWCDGTISAGSTMKKITKGFEENETIIIGMKLNMETRKISFSIDGAEYIEAPITLHHDTYRLAATLLYDQEQIELL